MQEKQFRADLYFRLDVLRVHLPPLRERLGDIEVLARRFVDDICDENRIARKILAAGAIRKTGKLSLAGKCAPTPECDYRAVVMAEGPKYLPPCRPWREQTECGDDLGFRAGRSQAIAKFEADYVRRVLEKHKGNVTRAAREAGKERRSFGRLAKKYRAG